MPYERCVDCGHIWHGLACAERTWKLFDGDRWQRLACSCPSAWQEPAVLADPQVLEVHPATAAASHDMHHGVALL